MRKVFVALFLISIALPSTATVNGEEGVHFFESKIRPALIKHCYECHSEEAGKRKGGLWLDRKEGWEAGGDSGAFAIPGDVDGSLLIKTIRYEDPDLEMPPDGKLPASVVEDFEKWVAIGLPDPRLERDEEADGEGIDIEAGREFWSFRPRTTDFGERKTIDDFIDSKLDKKGLKPLGNALPNQRLRRARVDLTGLVPTLEEQDLFEADSNQKQWEAFIDGWLQSEAFGERWGRHWMDIVRYSDSSGGGRALPFPNAWRFRDYVIEAFRQDKPINQLIEAHIAGDLLPYRSQKERSENLIATGFLVMGPNNYENQNKAELDFEIIDEQLDTMGRAFLGQTLGCARCHDHKFDPIPTRDYYALAGIFLSTNFVTHSNVSSWHKEPIPPTKEAHLVVAKHKTLLADAEKELKQIKAKLAAAGRGASGMSRSVVADTLPGVVIDDLDAIKIGEWMDSTHTGRWIGVGYIHDRNELRGEKAVRFETEFAAPGKYELRVSYSPGPSRSPSVQVKVNVGGDETVLKLNQRLEPEYDALFQGLGDFEVNAGERGIVEISNLGTNGHVTVDAVQWLPQNLDQGLTKAELLKSDVKSMESQLVLAESEVKRLKKSAPSLPQAMSVVDHKGGQVGDTEVRIRGVESNLGEQVPRGFLEVASWAPVEISERESGRLQLAHWLTHSDHPLTARVIANRIWLHLMGEGLVSTPDNFGKTGAAPTHPDLLDYLAGRLIDSGWSTKSLIREIMMSRAYSRATSSGRELQREQDPENQLYWRGHLRVLDAETMRDVMLTLAGTLDSNAGGPSLPAEFKSEFGHQFTTMRRSVYVPIFRNTGYEMFSVFNSANPNFTVGKRPLSTMPTQMLFMSNSDFVHARSAEAASELLQLKLKDDEARVEAAFRRTLSRGVSEEEMLIALKYLNPGNGAGEAQADVWAGLQRALFGSIDFRFLR